LSPEQVDFDIRLLEVGGLGLSTVRARLQNRLDLPSVMPVLDGTRVTRGVVRPTIAVLSDDWPRRPLSKPIHEHFGVRADTTVILTAFADDRHLEGLWSQRRRFIEHLDTVRPTAVIAPSFSTWRGDPWVEHAYQIKRSFEFYRLLQDAGQVAIPHIAWGLRVDADGVAAWLNENRITEIAVDAQCIGSLATQWIDELAWLRDAIDAAPHLIVGGLGPSPALHSLLRVWPETTFLYNGVAVAAAHRELRFDDAGRRCRVRHPRSQAAWPVLWPISTADPPPADLYRRSLEAFEIEVAAARERVARDACRSERRAA